jgi:hypothetical protein
LWFLPNIACLAFATRDWLEKHTMHYDGLPLIGLIGCPETVVACCNIPPLSFAIQLTHKMPKSFVFPHLFYGFGTFASHAN